MDKHTISEGCTIAEALSRLNEVSGDAMTLMAVDDSGRVTGTLTDGDIRRALVGGRMLDSKVSDVMHRDFMSVVDGNVDLDLLAEGRRRGIRLVPALDSAGRMVRILDLAKTPTILPLSAMMMAGGKGERLRPLTLTCPKPLLEVGGKAIIDYNIEALSRCGIDDIAVSTSYMAEMVEAHLREVAPGVRCLRENAPLGTIGSLGIAGDFRYGDVLVMNSDLLTDISFEEMFRKHKSEGADVTIAAISYTLAVPYAILQTEGPVVTSLREKPVYSYHANAGIYIFGEMARRLIDKGERIDATDLITRCIDNGLKVVYYPLQGTWIDIGTPADYAHACEIVNQRKM